MFTEFLDLASRAVGGGVVSANDEFFAERDNLVNPWPPVHRPQTFGAKGQVYDGWETRRRRTAGHDHAVVRLGAPGLVHGVVVDTAFFTGNYPPEASVEAVRLPGYPGPADLERADWFPLVPRSPLEGDSANAFPVEAERLATHVRLSIYPDGGVARLRVHGTPVPDPALLLDVFDLAAAEFGGRVTDCSDRFYGSPDRMLMPGLAASMGDGWETRRRRDAAHDWAEIRLAAPGVPVLAEFDTSHFKGNAPAAVRLTDRDGREVLPRTALQPDTRHRVPLAAGAPVDSVRLHIHPDGGMARFRLYGSLTPETRAALVDRWTALSGG